MKFKRSVCPIANFLEIMGDRWTLLIVRDLFLGKRRYVDFAESPEKVPTNILADRLKRMEMVGLIKKDPYQSHPVRYEYSLTEKGKALGPTLKEIVDWGLCYLKGTKVFPKRT